ncbi:hypothetical protein [Andreprevotia chitinilytica]|uniref:hypothetical protein n=1 Tax=Andreprevotia chitinilytica TaxID=396808 RepID=UPI0014705246|nr:hypothetical protein [Andreprevotia chitinilytica]
MAGASELFQAWAAALVAIQSRNISAEQFRGRTSTLTSKNRAHPGVQKRQVKLYRREGQVSMQKQTRAILIGAG